MVESGWESNEEIEGFDFVDEEWPREEKREERRS